MKIKWQVSLIFGVIGFFLTYVFSISNSTWLPSLVRAVSGFFLFAILGYILQFVLCTIESMKKPDSGQKHGQKAEISPELNQEEAVQATEKEEPMFESISIESLHQGKNT